MKFKHLVNEAMKQMEQRMPKNVTNVTSNVMSMPARMKAKKSIKQSSKDVAIIKKARAYKGMPNFDYQDKPMKEAINARVDLDNVKRKLKK